MVRRTLLVIGGGALALSVALSVITPPAVYGPAAVRQQLAGDLRELAVLTGLRERGRSVAAPLPIELAQEGGPLWLGPAITSAIDREPSMTRRASPHLLRLETVAEARTIVIRPALHRQGWSLKGEPSRIQLRPWVATLAAAIGAAVHRRWSRTGLGLLTAGLLAQLGAMLARWPQPPGAPGLIEAWVHGPLGRGVAGLAASLPDTATAVGAGVIVMCLVLIAFDARRSPQTGVSLLGFGLTGALGMLLWVEAAARTGFGGLCLSPAGVLAALLLVGGWLLWTDWSRAAERLRGGREEASS